LLWWKICPTYRSPDCGKKHKIFGDSHIDETAGKHKLKVFAKLPIDSENYLNCDRQDRIL